MLCVEVSCKLHTSHCLGPPSCNGYLVHRSKVGLIVTGCIGAHFARLNLSCHDVWHLELSGCITTLTVRNGGCKLLCSNGHLDRSRWMSGLLKPPRVPILYIHSFRMAHDTSFSFIDDMKSFYEMFHQKLKSLGNKKTIFRTIIYCILLNCIISKHCNISKIFPKVSPALNLYWKNWCSNTEQTSHAHNTAYSIQRFQRRNLLSTVQNTQDT